MQLLAGIGPLGLPELAVIAFIILLVFGVGRLPEVGGAVGKGIREFRKATKDDAPSDSTALPGAAAPDATASATAPAAASSDSIFCSECGGKNLSGAKFCAHCGHGIGAAVS